MDYIVDASLARVSETVISDGGEVFRGVIYPLLSSTVPSVLGIAIAVVLVSIIGHSAE